MNLRFYIMRAPTSALLHLVAKDAIGKTLCGRRVDGWRLESVPLATCFRCNARRNKQA